MYVSTARVPLQETFDRVVNALRTQNVKCVNAKGDCMYRGIENAKCAAGHLIPDEKYRPDIEYSGVALFSNPLSLPEVNTICDTKVNLLRPAGEIINEEGHDIILVGALQVVHDSYSLDSWENQWKKVADAFGLTYTERS